MPYMKRTDYQKWIEYVNTCLDEINAINNSFNIYPKDPIYYLSFCGSKHKIAVYYGNTVVAIGINRINDLLKRLGVTKEFKDYEIFL